MKVYYLLLLATAGCGIHAGAIEVTMGTTGFMEEVKKSPKTYSSGSPAVADSEYENPFEKKVTYKQIRQVKPSLPPAAE